MQTQSIGNHQVTGETNYLLEKWTAMEELIIGSKWDEYRKEFVEGATEVLVSHESGIIYYSHRSDDDWIVGVERSTKPELYEEIVTKLGDRPIW
jgi:hypothetical protein